MSDAELHALASKLSIKKKVDVQGESLVGSGGVVLPASADGAASRRLSFVSKSPESSPVALLICAGQAEVEELCGGSVGVPSSGRFCCMAKSQCLVARHLKPAFVAKAGHAYIKCPDGRGGPTAYCSPALNLSEVAGAVRNLIEGRQEDWDVKPVEVWTAIFEGLILNRHEAASIQSEAAASCSQKVSWMAATPKKRKGPLEEVLETGEGYESDLSALGESPKEITFGEVDGPSNREEQLGDIISSWNPMVKKVRHLNEELVDSVGLVDAKVMQIRGTLGSPPQDHVDLISPQVWPCLTGLCHEVEKVGAVELEVVKLSEDVKRVEALRQENSALTDKVSQLTSKLDDTHKLTSLLYEKIFVAPSPAAAPGYGTAQAVSSQGLEYLRDEMQVLRAGMENMRDTLANSQSRPDGQSITLLGVVYHSARDLQGWVLEHKAENLPLDIWSDCISMFEMAGSVGATSACRTEDQTVHKKAGHSSVEAGLLLNSFGTNVPSVFLRSRKTDHTFNVSATFRDWDRGDGLRGDSDSINTACTTWLANVTAQINRLLPLYLGDPAHAPVGTLARMCAMQSQVFWVEFRNWITKFYKRLTTRGEDSLTAGPGQSSKDYELMVKSTEKEAWELVRQVTMDIFVEFLKVRNVGHPSINMEDGVERTATVLFGTLRGHQFMAELLGAQFEKHPCLAPSMNNFCIGQKASLGDMERLEARIGFVTKTMAEMKAEFHKGKK